MWSVVGGRHPAHIDDLEPFADALAALPFERPYSVLTVILGWTGGDPYLTQEICGELAREGSTMWSEESVGHLVERLFLSERSHDLNLRFNDKMLEDRSSLSGDPGLSPDRREVLRIYRDVRDGRTAVVDDEQSRAKSILKVAELGGELRRSGSRER